jgi:hypothetical protein
VLFHAVERRETSGRLLTFLSKRFSMKMKQKIVAESSVKKFVVREEKKW